MELSRCFDESEGQAGFDVPLDVAVEERDAWVVGFEADDGVAVTVNEDGVSAHGRRWGVEVGWGSERWPVVRTGARACDDLEFVAMEMERVSASVVVNYREFDDGAVGENVGVCGGAVDEWVVDQLGGCAEGSVEGWDLDVLDSLLKWRVVDNLRLVGCMTRC